MNQVQLTLMPVILTKPDIHQMVVAQLNTQNMRNDQIIHIINCIWIQINNKQKVKPFQQLDAAKYRVLRLIKLSLKEGMF